MVGSMIALMLLNELPSQHIIDLRFNNPVALGVMIGTLLLGVSITVLHVIREVRHV